MTRQIILNVDDDDYDAIQQEFAKRQRLIAEGFDLPEGESDLPGAMVGEIVRELWEYEALWEAEHPNGRDEHMKYRYLGGATVEAIQFTDGSPSMWAKLETFVGADVGQDGAVIIIPTADGPQYLRHMGWVVKFPSGDLVVMQEETFGNLFEPVRDF